MDEFNTNRFPTSIDNAQHFATNVSDDEDLPTWVDNSAYNMDMDEGLHYLSPVQYKSVTGNTDHIIGENKPLATPAGLSVYRQISETMYGEIPEIPESLELEEFPTQAAVQTPAIQTFQTATNILGAAEKNTRYPKKWNGRKDVYRSEDLDGEQYLATDYIDNERSKTKSEFNCHELPTSMDNREVLPTPINNSAGNTRTSQGYLSPLQYEPVPGLPDFIIDQNQPQTPPPPLPPDRQPNANMYEEIPEIPEHLGLEETHTQAGIQLPNPTTITAAGDTRGQKRAAVLVTVGILTCITTLFVAIFLTYIHSTKNEDGSSLTNTILSKCKFT